MRKQVLSREQMQHLKELGVDTSKASMALVYENKYGDVVDWEIVDDQIHESTIGEFNKYLRERYGVFTLQDILDLLPEEIKVRGVDYSLNILFPNSGLWEVSYCYGGKCEEYFMGKDLIEIAYQMLCWCIENNHIKTKG